MTTTHRPK